MKITLASSQRAGAFIITLVLIGFVALSLSTYFLLTQGEYNSVQRSETWNSALVMAEAGVDDAMTLINVKQSNFNQLSNWTVSAVSSNNWDINNQSTYRSLYAGWSSTSGTIYHVRRSPDTNAGYYDVYVNSSLSTSSNGPSILSIGTTLWKNPGANGGSSSNGIGVSYTGDTARKIFVQTKRDGIINANLAAIVSMNLSGNNVTADSFDSGDPYHSSWQTNMTYRGGFYYGFYPATPTAKTSSLAPDYATEPYFRKDNAYLASDGSLSVGNANICGYAITGPGLFPSIGPNGTVGDNLTWIGNGITCDPLSPANYGIQTGHARDDMNVTFQDVTLPTNAWVAVPKLSGGSYLYGSTNVGGPIDFKNGYIITNGIAGGTFYYTISGNVATPILIKGTNIVLYLPGGLNFNGPGNTIWIETNSDLTIYSGGNIDTTGNNNSGLNNISKYAPAFSVFGLPGCTTIKLAGSPTMTAYIYAPEADLYLVGGGGGSYYDAVGAFFCKNVKLTGNMNFHYDEALSLLGPSRGYIPSYWQEVP